MGCLLFKESKLNFLENLKTEEYINSRRELTFEKDVHKYLNDLVNRLNLNYDLNLKALATVKEVKIKNGKDFSRDSEKFILTPIEESFEQIDNRRKELGIYEDRISIGEYNKTQSEKISNQEEINLNSFNGDKALFEQEQGEFNFDEKEFNFDRIKLVSYFIDKGYQNINENNFTRIFNDYQKFLFENPQFDIDDFIKLIENDKYSIQSDLNSFIDESKKIADEIKDVEQQVQETTIKPGVSELFRTNPELSKIGTVEQYSQYLDTIFPDSKVRDIVYHHSDTKITEFKKEFPEGYAAQKGVSPKAKFFLRKPLKEEFLSKRPHLGKYLINTINPNIMPVNADRSAKRDSGIKEGIQDALDNNQDGAIFDNIWDNRTWSDVLVVFEPEQIHILSSKADIEGFKEFVGKSSENSIQFNVSPNEINYELKSVEILSSQKADEIFRKGDKNSWSIDKILTELQIPKDQQDLIKSFNTRNREEIITSLLANYSYSIEINTAKEGVGEHKLSPHNFYDNFSQYKKDGKYYMSYADQDGKTGEYSQIEKEITKQEFEANEGSPTQHYSNLTVPGGTNGSYIEANIETPLITPSIKGHSQFSTDTSIGWYRMDEKQQYQEKDIENLIEIMKKSGILEVNCN